MTNERKREFSKRELDEIETSNLSGREFKVMIIQILNSMKKDMETIKNDKLEIKKCNI